MYKTSLVECKKETLIYKNTQQGGKKRILYIYTYTIRLCIEYIYVPVH